MIEISWNNTDFTLTRTLRNGYIMDDHSGALSRNYKTKRLTIINKTIHKDKTIIIEHSGTPRRGSRRCNQKVKSPGMVTESIYNVNKY